LKAFCRSEKNSEKILPYYIAWENADVLRAHHAIHERWRGARDKPKECLRRTLLWQLREMNVNCDDMVFGMPHVHLLKRKSFKNHDILCLLTKKPL